MYELRLVVTSVLQQNFFYLQGYANLLVIIFDVDTSLDDIVDGILIPLRSDVRKGFCEPTLYTGYFGYAQLEVRFRVDCDNNFYGEGEYNTSSSCICMCI